jgi:hypothetical protein
MIKILFTTLIVMHGLIHLMGFLKAFRMAQISQLVQEISPVAGLFWLAAAVLFLAAALSFALGTRWWWILGGIALVVSQILVISAWSDAKYGTVLNVIVLAAVVIAYGSWSFHATSVQELKALLAHAGSEKTLVTEPSVGKLPAPIRTWLRRSHVVGKKIPRTVHLRQKGTMRTSRGGKWMPFEAEQWFTTEKPGFLWQAEVAAGPGVSLVGRDTYSEGRGHMVIKMMSLFPVADALGKETDQGVLVRFLAEICWFPSAALLPYIEWEGIDSASAKATMSYGGVTASGVFTFNEQGDMVRFEAKRYYERDGSFSLEPWIVETLPKGMGEFEGVRMPVRSAVSWMLDGVPFTWLTLEITDLSYQKQDRP